MLVAGPNSACDVCLENFGRDGKAPCSISCGHVFCVDCLSRVERPQCPFCRNYFDPRSTIKLHLDLDNVKSSPTSTAVVSLTNDEEDADRLREQIISIAATGCSESTVRKLLADGKAFLARVPKTSYKDLRTHHRLITYLCDIKTDLRGQKATVEKLTKQTTQDEAKITECEKEIEMLLQEKKLLLQQLEKSKQAYEKSVNSEIELREHCKNAHEAYTSMINQYNYVAGQWSKLNDEVKTLRMLPSANEVIVQNSPPSLELDHRRLTGAAVRQRNSILCTPLPQFTCVTGKSLFIGPLPGTEEEEEDEEGSDDTTANADEEDDEEDEEDEESSEESDPEPSERHLVDQTPTCAPATRKLDPPETLCTYASHPYSCKCSDSDDANSRKLIVVAQPSHLAYVDHVKPSLIQGGLSRTAPGADVRRARSYSNPSSSSSRGASSSRSASRSPLPAVRTPAPTVGAPVYNSPLSQASHKPRAPADSHALRSRLHNILSDAGGSSPPKTTTLVSASAVAREREHRAERYRSPSPSRSPSPPQHSSHLRRHSSQLHRSQPSQQSSTTDQFSRMLVSHQSHQTPTPPLSTSPNARKSSASEAARVLEQSKRDRQRAEYREGERNRRSAEREPSQPDQDLQRARASSASSASQVTGPSFHQKIQAAAGALDVRHGAQATGAGVLHSRPSTNFGGSYGGAMPVQQQQQHREYVQSSQPLSRYNTVGAKGFSSTSLVPQGAFTS